MHFILRVGIRKGQFCLEGMQNIVEPYKAFKLLYLYQAPSDPLIYEKSRFIT